MPPKRITEKMKLGSSYTMLITSILLQLSDKSQKWTVEQCVAIGLTLVAVLLAKEYNSNCNEPTTPTARSPNEPVSESSQ